MQLLALWREDSAGVRSKKERVLTEWRELQEVWDRCSNHNRVTLVGAQAVGGPSVSR